MQLAAIVNLCPTFCTVQFFRVFRSPPYFFNATLIVFNTLFALVLYLFICFSQFNLLYSVIPKNWLLFLEGITSIISMISICSSLLFLLFLNIMLTVLLGEKISSFSAAHPSNLLIIPCNALEATLWYLVVMYIARLSAKGDSSTPLPNILLIATRKRVMLSIPPCQISRSVCLLCETDPHTFTLIHLSLISYVMNSIILPCIPMFSSSSNVISLFTLS